MTSEGGGSRPGAVPGRVAVVQGQTRTTLACRLRVRRCATAIALVIPHHTGWWLPLHLFLAGALLLAISAATQLFAVTWAAGPPAVEQSALPRSGGYLPRVSSCSPRRASSGGRARCAALGGAGVIVALLMLAASLRRTVRAGVQRRFDGALRTYLCALVAGMIGCALGIAMVVGLSGSTQAASSCRALDAQPTRARSDSSLWQRSRPSRATQARVKMSPARGRAQGVLLGLVRAPQPQRLQSDSSHGRSSVAAVGSRCLRRGTRGPRSCCSQQYESSNSDGRGRVSCNSAPASAGGPAQPSSLRGRPRPEVPYSHDPSSACWSSGIRADPRRRARLSRTRSPRRRSSTALRRLSDHSIVARADRRECRRGRVGRRRVPHRCGRARRLDVRHRGPRRGTGTRPERRVDAMSQRGVEPGEPAVRVDNLLVVRGGRVVSRRCHSTLLRAR